MSQHRLYLGTYTRSQPGAPSSEGIYRADLNAQNGQLSDVTLVARVENPSFVALSPDGGVLYAVCDIDGSAVGAWRLKMDGTGEFLGHQPAGGAGACHLSLDPSGQHLFCANYGGGSVACFPISENGALGERSGFIQHVGSGPNAARQEAPHAHAIYSDETGRFCYACDLGTDEIVIYDFDAASGTLSRADVPAARVAAGAGPRHLALDARGFAYCNNELDLTVTAFRRDFDSGALTELQTIETLPPGASRARVSTAEIALHPSGKWLYVSNRGHESIAVFQIGAEGELSCVAHVATPAEPRGFGLSPDGEWLVVGGQNAHQVAAFQIDAATGQLTHNGQNVEIGAPVCVVFAN